MEILDQLETLLVTLIQSSILKKYYLEEEVETIQTFVEKFINKMSTGILLLMLIALFSVWTIGIGTPATLFLYEHSAQFVTFGVFVLTGLNIYKARGFDFFI